MLFFASRYACSFLCFILVYLPDFCCCCFVFLLDGWLFTGKCETIRVSVYRCFSYCYILFFIVVGNTMCCFDRPQIFVSLFRWLFTQVKTPICKHVYVYNMDVEQIVEVPTNMYSCTNKINGKVVYVMSAVWANENDSPRHIIWIKVSRLFRVMLNLLSEPMSVSVGFVQWAQLMDSITSHLRLDGNNCRKWIIIVIIN